ncbi:MAG TPA: hypothetical protein PKI93_05025 [Alphaproteobacteria bacterium]|nr:hypothetical protein [Alphaproteobacteria bacterium]HNS45417.1 hypothetical protein [Alphaproteobacteria bacterium]
MLNPKDKQRLAKLVYRCAMWVSLSDEKGGASAQSLEERVLKRSIQDLYRKFANGSDEREILGIALANTHNWRAWNENLINLIPELKEARPVMSPSIRRLAMDLAKDVATAFQERSMVSSWVVQITVSIRSLFSKLNPNLTPQECANISGNEKAALYELADALEITDFNI